MTYTKRQLQSLDTIEQAWDGDELKIWKDETKVWLSHPDNRKYNGDYTIERLVDGRWEQENCWFE